MTSEYFLKTQVFLVRDLYKKRRKARVARLAAVENNYMHAVFCMPVDVDLYVPIMHSDSEAVNVPKRSGPVEAQSPKPYDMSLQAQSAQPSVILPKP